MLCYFGCLKMNFEFVRHHCMEVASEWCSDFKWGDEWKSCCSRFQRELHDMI